MTKESNKIKKGKYVMVCPKCNSSDIDMDKSNPLQPAMGLPPIYICNNCGYRGHIFPEVPIFGLSEFKNKARKEGLVDTKKDEDSKVDTRYGEFCVKVLWKITAPVILLVGIFLLFKEPIYGIIFTAVGLLMLYITYFKKRKIE